MVSHIFEGIVSPIKGVPDFVGLSLSFDVLWGFISHFDNVFVGSFMDLSIFF